MLVEPKLYAAAKPEVRTRILGNERNGERENSKHYVIKNLLWYVLFNRFLGGTISKTG